MVLKIAVETVFWVSVAALGYTYAGYPLLVFLISALRSRPVRKEEIERSVSVIITAYNEERDLQSKLENTLTLDYPPGKLEIIVASDCSSDRTDEIARSFASRGVRLHRQPQRLGKTAAQNAAVELAHGEVILFSDATTMYRPDVLRVMTPSFADPSVGCVAGRLIYVDPAETGVGKGARSYWGYETFIKEHESQINSLIGVSGCLYAVKRSAYRPMYHEACSDFLIATLMVEQGLRAVFEPNAVCTEETNHRADREMRMRVRVIVQTLNDLWRFRPMLNPLTSGFYAVQLVSHKLFRYFVPLVLCMLFLSSVWLSTRGSTFFEASLAVQLCFYATALVGLVFERLGMRIGIFALPFYFMLANAASLWAMFEFARGERYARWEPIREVAAPVASLEGEG
jgi:cellulose synthase/poly-beta-1,6-N-acetylglucosamine synthase-like glycosyltransferase